MDSILRVSNLDIGFPTATGWLSAVQQVSLTLRAGQVLGLVGESGSGKSLTSAALLRLLPTPGQITRGEVWFTDNTGETKDLLTLPAKAMTAIRGRHIALIPQDPMTSLNPVYTVGDQLAEVMTHHLGYSQTQAWQRAADLLDMVRMPSAKTRLKDYPHQFSGGMRQRVMIAMALSCNPSVLIADEPTTALDVTVQAQILDLLRSIQQDNAMAILFITHDLGVVAELCDEVAVMYAGRIVEQANVHTLFANPQHPYTQGLLSCIPQPHLQQLVAIPGQPPRLGSLPPGCAFAPRCPHYTFECDTAVPALATVGQDHRARCIKIAPTAVAYSA
jgi:peptide/nickel transport system ATP-binding protein